MKRTTKHPARKIQVEQQLAAMLAALAIPELVDRFSLVSITRVELARDLKSGVVWVTAAPAVDHQILIEAMQRRLSAWRQDIRARLALRYFPNLVFRYDEGQADSLHIEALLEQS